jgi:AcrR family transcriptional regulator
MSATIHWKARSLPAADRLLAAAANLFSENGYSATSVESVALQAGANKALVSYHFGGKEGLYQAVRGEIMALLLKAAAPRPSAGILAGRHADLLLERLSQVMVKRPLVARWVLRETLGDGPPAADGLTVLDHLTDLLAGHQQTPLAGTGSDAGESRQHARSALVMLMDQATQPGDARTLKRTHAAITAWLEVARGRRGRRRSGSATGNRPCLPGRPPDSLI